MKSLLARILGIGFLAFLIAFVSVFLNGKADASSEAIVKALVISVIAFGWVVLLQGIAGVMLDNRIAMNKEKDWTDFWGRDMFEYFYKSEESIQDPWRISRGRYLLYLAVIAGDVIMVVLFFFFLNLLR